MQVHRFAVGETVLYTETHIPDLAWKASYTVVACIRSDDAEPQYLIRSIHRVEERVVGEHELCRTPQPLRTSQWPENGLFDDVFDMDAANFNLPSIADRPFAPRRMGSLTGGRHV
ncbi:hypothetical protein [Microvirga sp. 2TAF3]|uniref:hypothetical protein n=1 Tax=Microvirga sp. 2TAF3 TaxID=3233014 RepID=UPI003F98D609